MPSAVDPALFFKVYCVSYNYWHSYTRANQGTAPTFKLCSFIIKIFPYHNTIAMFVLTYL